MATYYVVPTGNPEQSAGHTTSPPGYPVNPAGEPDFDPRPGSGIPLDASSISQGIEILGVCPVGCGRAVSERDLPGHVQAHNEQPFRSGFGDRSGEI
jgi:hypothetical protein